MLEAGSLVAPKCLSTNLSDFQNMPGPPTIFKTFLVLENAKPKFTFIVMECRDPS